MMNGGALILDDPSVLTNTALPTILIVLNLAHTTSEESKNCPFAANMAKRRRIGAAEKLMMVCLCLLKIW